MNADAGRPAHPISGGAHAAEPTFADVNRDVLATLRRQGPPFALTPTALVERTMVTSGAVSKRVDRLADRGLVVRRPRQSDRRSVVVVLTARGRRVIDTAMEEHVANEARLLEGLSADERAALATLLAGLATSLGV